MADTLELRAQRVRLKISTAYMADKLGISEDNYRKKETGKTIIRDSEKVIIFRELKLTLKQFNDIFYDGQLPIGYSENPTDGQAS